MSSRRKLAYLLLPLMAAGLGIIALLIHQGQPVIRGVVRDEAGSVAGAVVRWRGSNEYVLSDTQGHFSLAADGVGTDSQLTAWSPGYFVGGDSLANLSESDGLVIQLHPHPTSDHPEYAFISPVLDLDNPTACGHCHVERSGETNGAMPVDEWRLDAHSGAAVNPRFLSLYNGTTVDGAAGTPTTFRFDAEIGVNVPVAPSMGGDAVGPGFRLDYPTSSGSCAACHVPVLALQNPSSSDPNQAAGVAAEGITCDLCHKIQNVRLRADGRPDPGLPGVLSVEFLRPHEGEQVFIGPFDDTPGDDIYSPLQTQSQVCSACHSGQFWDVRIYDSFGEWLDSPYSDPVEGRTCQDCHMPHSGVTRFAQLPPDNPLVLPARDSQTIFSHRMPGAADPTLLENTATLTVEAVREGDTLQAVVRVTNSGAGHHIPTDNPLRNMILLIQAVDGEDQPLALLDGPTIPPWGGEGDPAKGDYAGLPGVLYAKLLADFYTGETPSYAYWRQTRLVSDNRIPALAMDESHYTFAAPAESGELTVEARLYLRRAFIDLMDLKEWDTPDVLMEHETVRVS